MSDITKHLKVNIIVKNIYTQAVEHAKYSENTSYNYPLLDNFTKSHAHAVVSELQERLPKCRVSHTLLAAGSDGRLYDVANISDEVLPLVDTVIKDSYIVIDWS